LWALSRGRKYDTITTRIRCQLGRVRSEDLTSLCQRITRRMAIANGTCVSFCNQFKAHFGLPWVRPWDNCGKCHMDKKRIQCLSKASQHVPIYIFNRFPVIQRVVQKFAILAHFLHNLAYPGYVPRTIAVNITWMERGFNAGQTHSSIYTSIFNRSEILVGNCNFFLTLAFNAPVGVFRLKFREKVWSSEY